MVTDSDLFEWCDTVAHKANNLYNAALFRIRQCMTSRTKDRDQLTDHELEVLNEIDCMNNALVSRERSQGMFLNLVFCLMAFLMI
jgi:hypothetical protein